MASEDRENPNVYRARLSQHDLAILPNVRIIIPPFESCTHSMAHENWEAIVKSTKYSPRTHLRFYQSRHYSICCKIHRHFTSYQELFEFLSRDSSRLYIDSRFNVVDETSVYLERTVEKVTTLVQEKIVPVEKPVAHWIPVQGPPSHIEVIKPRDMTLQEIVAKHDIGDIMSEYNRQCEEKKKAKSKKRTVIIENEDEVAA